MLYIGTAGWTVPVQCKNLFPPEGSHLERYAEVFNCVEINSAFYKDHKPVTYQRWAASVPLYFRFAVKLSRYFTHDRRLQETGPRLKEVIEGVANLGEKWGALLVQLPPSLNFDSKIVDKFMTDLRVLYGGPLFLEPRHSTWTSREAVALLACHGINKVLADPEPCRIPRELRPPLEKIRYLRLHGMPEIYKSRYSEATIARIAERIEYPFSPAAHTWCIFDNTTFGYATENALELQKLSKKITSPELPPLV